MQPDFFESSTVSLILSWLSAASVFTALIGTLLFLFLQKHEGVPRTLSIWVGICMILFSPLRYIFFQVDLALSYTVQSFSAFFTGMLMSIWVVPVFAIIYLIVIGAPIAAASLLLANQARVTFTRGLVLCILVPVVCVISNSIFYLGLPYAGVAVGWMANPKDLIKATNGSAAVLFKYVASPLTPLILPSFYSDTPQKDVDLLRCHVASTYLSDKTFGYFVKHQYPEIYEKEQR